MSEKIGACIIILDQTRKQVLLGKRISDHKSGFYGLPAGSINERESIVDCAKRELFEEVGLKTNELKYVGVIREYDSNGSFIHFAFLCDKYNGKIILKEPNKCEKWEFFTLDKLPKNILNGHKAAIEIFTSKNDKGLRDIV